MVRVSYSLRSLCYVPSLCSQQASGQTPASLGSVSLASMIVGLGIEAVELESGSVLKEHEPLAFGELLVTTR